jgi:hypothetical protein
MVGCLPIKEDDIKPYQQLVKVPNWVLDDSEWKTIKNEDGAWYDPVRGIFFGIKTVD